MIVHATADALVGDLRLLTEWCGRVQDEWTPYTGPDEREILRKALDKRGGEGE